MRGAGIAHAGGFAERDVLQRGLARVYDRLGARIVVLIMVFAGAVAFVNTLVTAVWFSQYLGLSNSQFVVVCAVGLVIVNGGALLAVAMSRAPLIHLLTWSGDARTPANAPVMWNLAVRAPFAIVTRGAVVVGLLGPVLVAFTIAYVDAPAWAAVPTFVSYVTGTVAGWVIITFGAEFLARPMLEDIASFLPADFEPSARAWRLRTKALAPLPVVAYVASLTVGAFVDVQVSGPERLSIALVVALATVSIAGVIFLVVTRSVLDPLDELIAATRRVQAGDLRTRVPLVTADDLGTLAASFNRMMEGLQERESLRDHNAELNSALEASLVDVRKQADELRTSRARVVAAADAERRRVERDLHDGAQQHLVILGLKLGLVSRSVHSDEKLAALVKEVQGDLDRALVELRDLAHGIYPQLLENEGLPGALREAAERAAIPTSLSCDGAGRYPREVEAAVYFCCLEALQNASKHAGEGARATVELADRGGALTFSISDDGPGFDASVNGAGSGLENMHDRIGALGGTVEIASKAGEGTRVVGRVPLGAGT